MAELFATGKRVSGCLAARGWSRDIPDGVVSVPAGSQMMATFIDTARWQMRSGGPTTTIGQCCGSSPGQPTSNPVGIVDGSGVSVSRDIIGHGCK